MPRMLLNSAIYGKVYEMRTKSQLLLVRLAGFEPATLEFVVRYSIQMSYRRNGCIFIP